MFAPRYFPDRRTSPDRRTRFATLIGLAAVAAVTLAACSSSSPSPSAAKSTTTAPSTTTLSSLETPPSGPVSLSETGSTLLYPLFNLWVPAYKALHPNITVTTAGTGSGTGISQAAAGTVNIGASDAYLSSGQVSQSPGLLNVPLAISAQMVNYNLPGFSGTLRLNGAVLSAMYQGKIKSWNDPLVAAINPGVALPNLAVVPLHRSDGSGDTFIFTQYLSKADPSGWGQSISFGTTVAFPAVPGALGENGNGGMVTGCAATPGCVAYIGVSFQAQTQQKNLGQAQLQNASGNFEALTSQTVAAEAAGFAATTPADGAISLVYGPATGGYPIINYEYAIVSSHQPDASTAQAVKALLAWTMDPNGGSSPTFLKQVQFQALPTSAVDVATKLLTQIQ